MRKQVIKQIMPNFNSLLWEIQGYVGFSYFYGNISISLVLFPVKFKMLGRHLA